MNLKKIIPFLIFICFSVSVFAQDQAEIKAVFEKYERRKGTVAVQLSQDVLSQGCNLQLYKSLSFAELEDEEKTKIVQSLLQKKKEYSVISEAIKNGKIQSGSYSLGKTRNNKESYLLIKSNGNRLNVVYIVGDVAPNQLEKELKKLKQLFIYSNNKKINID